MYPSSLKDREWAVISAAIPPGIKSGRPRKWSARVMLDAIFYVEKTGCQWRQLPSDFPPWKRVYNTYWRWRERGIWDRVLTVLREELRVKQGRNAQPSVAIVDSQSVKTVAKAGNAATTRARRPRVASGTSRSIRKGSCSQ